MKRHRLKNLMVAVTTGLVLINTVWASTSVWTFAPVSGYPASVSVSPSETKTIKYIVTNQSHKLHRVQMKPIQGIESSGSEVSPRISNMEKQGKNGLFRAK